MAKSTSKKTVDEDEVPIPEKEETISKEEEKQALDTIKPADLKILDELDAKITRFEKEYADLVIEDENDKDAYERVRLGLADMRTTRTGLSQQKLAVTLPYRTATAYINSRYAAKINKISAIEAPLKARKKEIDEIEANRKEQERLERAKKLNDRINELTKNGAAFDGEYYSIGSEEYGITEISIGVVDVENMTDTMYKNILQQVIDKNEAIKSRKEEAERKQREEAEEQKRKDDEERERVRLQQEKIDADKREMEEKQRQMNEKLKKMQEAQNKIRIGQLTALGLTYNAQYNAYTFADVNVDVATELVLFEDEAWDELIEKITPRIAEIKEQKQKEEAEELRIKELVQKRGNELRELGFVLDSHLESYVNLSTRIDLETLKKLEVEKWDTLLKDTKEKLAEAKAAAEKEIREKALREENERREKEQREREEQEAAMKDKDKWQEYKNKLLSIPQPTMTGKQYQIKVQKIAEILTSL